MDKTLAWLWLADAVGSACQNARDLLALYPDPEALYEALCAGREAPPYFLSDHAVAQLCDTTPFDYEERLDHCLLTGVEIITPDDAAYPDRLRDLPDMPLVLYVTGEPACLNGHRYVGMVGTRRPSAYGRQAAFDLSLEMAKQGAVIVSGLADGLDSEGHRAAVEAGTPTVAFLGTAIDTTYPAANVKLRQRIEKGGGTVCSEYPPGYQGKQKGTFLARNRLIAGLSEVLCVAEARIRSGTLNTVSHAESLGRPVLAVDDDPAKLHQTIHGVPVKGTLEQIPELCKRYGIHTILVAIPTLRGSRLNHVIDLCVSTHCAVQLLSDPQLVGSGAPQQGAFRELNPADFLSRDEVTLDMEKISGYLTGKTVLVTGGGGSIGSELCRQVMRFHPGKLLIFDIYENCAYELQMELQQKYGRDIPVTVLIGSIRDKKRLDEVFETYHPTVVFHAAAHKHVPLMEVSPAEAVKNNVLGTKNLLVSASEHGVERFVQLSTDKAVNPTSVMGCTKRICEMLIQTFAGNTDMKCVAVRFGNVLGSHGSVIPLFEAQIKKGGPVTLTDENIERYFMTIPEAAQLVLQAGALAESGNIYVLDMGEPVKIMDLAKQLIRFYGYEPGVNMEIKVVGLRPGEKLYEELMMDEEQDKMRRTQHNKIFVASPRTIDLAQFYEQLQALEAAAAHNDEGVVKQLAAMIPTFTPTRENLKL